MPTSRRVGRTLPPDSAGDSVLPRMAAERVTFKRLREHRQALDEFLAAYNTYLSSTDDMEARARLNRLIPAAEAAMDALGMGFAVLPPPASGSGPVIRHLANVAFLHEKPGFGTLPNEQVIDVVEQTLALIEEREKMLRRLRRRPLYWLDRAVRALLGIPAYLISVLVGVPKPRIETSWWGPPLRILGLVADVAGIYGVGRLLKWW